MSDTRSDYKDIWYESADGLQLYARDYPCNGSRDNPPTLLCMHGLTRNSADFEDLAPALQGLARVISVDQRGRGRSAWDSHAANYTPATYVNDMFTLIDKLALNDLILVGTSMGGLMSILMVTMRQELFRGVVLNDIGPVVNQEGLDRIKSYVGKGKPVDTWDDAIDQTRAINKIAFPNYQHADWARWVHRMYEENDSGGLTIRYDPAIAEPMSESDSNAAPPDLWPLFENLKSLPLLVIRGELRIVPDEINPDPKTHHHRIQKKVSVMRLEKITLEKLLETSPEIDLLRVRSCDPELYLVEVEIQQTCFLVTDNHGEMCRFRGLNAAKKPFAGLTIKNAVLVHESAYDEMIGQPASHNRMEVRISLPEA